MLGDCLERMKEIESGSVDAIICDPPYGTMKGMNYGSENHDGHQWDTALEIKPMFEECNRILRTNGALILFSQEPYTSKLITQAHGNIPFSYRLTWLKDNFANALLVNKAPVNYTEDVCVFFKKHTKHDFEGFHPLRDYFKDVFDYIGLSKKAIIEVLGQRFDHCFRFGSTQFSLCTEEAYSDLIAAYGINNMKGFKPYGELKPINDEYRADLIAKMTSSSPKVFNLPEGKKFKSNVLEYKKDYTGHHPTQKPVALMEDLIKTYTNEGDTVLDFTMGSGSTGVAAKNLNRDFIGIEMDEGYFKIAQERINGIDDDITP